MSLTFVGLLVNIQQHFIALYSKMGHSYIVDVVTSSSKFKESLMILSKSAVGVKVILTKSEMFERYVTLRFSEFKRGIG